MKIENGTFMITGGVSLVGSHITEQLLEQGAKKIILFDNYSLGSPDMIADILQDPRVKLVRGDILRTNELYDNLEGVDGVFMVAAFLTLPLSQNPQLGLSVNVQGQISVLEACRYRGVKRVVLSSSIATYGDPKADLIDETHPFEWQTLSPAGVLYGASKIMGENLLRLYHQRHGIGTVSLRYSSVYGERQHYRGVNALYIIETYDKILRNERPTIPDDGSEVHDYVHAGDVARANIMAMASDVSGESFNVCTGKATTLNDLVDIVLKVTGSDLKPEYKTDPNAVRVTTSDKLNLSIEKIKKAIGWEPKVSLEDGVRRVIKWRESQASKA
jgi:UDP-glucose 4-epimerase